MVIDGSSGESQKVQKYCGKEELPGVELPWRLGLYLEAICRLELAGTTESHDRK